MHSYFCRADGFEVEGPGERWYGLNSFKRVSLDSYLQLQPFISARPKSRHPQPFRTDDIEPLTGGADEAFDKLT